jgi:hypothetical protein
MITCCCISTVFGGVGEAEASPRLAIGAPSRSYDFSFSRFLSPTAGFLPRLLRQLNAIKPTHLRLITGWSGNNDKKPKLTSASAFTLRTSRETPDN